MILLLHTLKRKTTCEFVFVRKFYNTRPNNMIVNLPEGKIQGAQLVTPKNNIPFHAFLSIPYAQPPVGKLRFQAPVAAKNWTGVKDCTKFTSICYQMGNVDKDYIDLQSEDSLHINVFTPKIPTDLDKTKLPVMFFVHGGAFLHGHASPLTKGPLFFMEYGIVLVTFNYRLGPFGFLSTQDSVIPGNAGLKDQLLALKWVNKNIHLFGGNASELTVFGQSAGGASVSYLLMNEEARGLYRGAILQSGTALSPWAFQRNAREHAFKTASYLDESFKNSKSSKELLNFLQTLPPEDVMAAANKLALSIVPAYVQLLQGFVYAPVIENDSSGYIVEKPYEAFEKGNMNRVPLIIGITSEESLRESSSLGKFIPNVEQFSNHVDLLISDDMNVSNKEERLRIAREILQVYTKKDHLHEDVAASIKFFSDSIFNRAIIKSAELKSKFTTVYFYQLSYKGEMGGPDPNIEGVEKVGHAEENGYFWSRSSNKNLDEFPKEDIATQERLLKLWTDFAKYLNPTPKEGKPDVVWPSVTNEGEDTFCYLDIDKSLTVKNTFPKEKEYKAWTNLYNNYGKRPFDTY